MDIVTAPARAGRQELPDGRMLGWAEWGPPGGTPVLCVPGAATTRRLGFGATAVARLGVRLISVDRPGLGASTPAPGRTFTDFAEDMRAFARLRGLGRPAMVGHSQGAPFALACAAAGVAGALAVVSGADEVAAPHFAGALPAELRGLVDLTAADPGAAEELFARFSPDAMWDLVMTSSPEADLAVYREPGFAAAYRAALADAFAQGPMGYARDTVLAMGRWGIDLRSVTAPVDLWYGELDLTHSPDQGAALAARIPGAVHHRVPRAGGALLWTHAEEILGALLGRLPSP
ncbi:alpha/beta fold hydrolase [Streptomyces purpureus]|uniref:alpha/beta fold hydrolase n=1 Tax=Streptomyces purpureus TaxID=1951 RepID=UPI00048B7971|nr:alpha/beta hydrolase [Streptomyces purpureus]